MWPGTHIVAGLIAGKLFGNYTLAILVSIVIDFDHIIIYIKHNIIFKPKELWKAITVEEDPYGYQRNFLHNIFTWAIISGITIFINKPIGLVISASYLFHLILD